MEPNKPNENIFRVFLYDYLKKRGLLNTAESLRNEAPIFTGQIPAEYDMMPHGFLYDFWKNFYEKYNSGQQRPEPSGQSQAPNVGAVMNTTPRIISEGYSPRHLLSFPSYQTLSSCDFSSDGSIVASGGIGKPFICYLETGVSVNTFESHLSAIFEIRFQPQTSIFATCSADKTVKLWDAKRPERLLFDFVGHNRIVKSLDFHPTEEILCSSDTHNVIEVWDLHKCVRLENFKAGGSILRFQPNSGRVLAVANRNVITILDFLNRNVLNRLEGHEKDIKSICWDVSGEKIASVSEDGVRVWSVFTSRKCIYMYPSNGKRFQSVIFHPRYHNVLVIGGFQCLQLLIIKTGETNIIYASDLSITGLAATTAQSELFASASNDSVVKIWK